MVILPLVICLLILAFLFQGSRGIWQPDEGYYTGTAVTMMSKHNLFVPYLGEHEIFLDKPPMIYWGIIAGLKLFGHNEFAVRFFHGLCFMLTSLAVGSLSYPTQNNMKTLWAQVDKYLPSGNYELCTVDKRADGLLFYGAHEVEHLTDDSNPYPTFTEVETILEEIQEFIKENDTGLFLVTKNDDIAKAIDILKKSGIECHVVSLPYQRAMLFPYLACKSNIDNREI